VHLFGESFRCGSIVIPVDANVGVIRIRRRATVRRKLAVVGELSRRDVAGKKG
jgi:hypothetical protein